jgi:cytochrome c556
MEKCMKHRLMLAAAAALAAGFTCAALAQTPKPEDEIRYRQSVMNVMGHSFGALGAMAQGKMAFNAQLAADSAGIVEMMSKLPWNSFGPGTDKGAPTKADTKIWSETDKFKDKSEKMRAEVAKLAQAAKSGDEAAIKAATGDAGKACKSCHDDFRLKEFRQ